jgi:hypothetical protein
VKEENLENIKEEGRKWKEVRERIKEGRKEEKQTNKGRKQ